MEIQPPQRERRHQVQREIIGHPGCLIVDDALPQIVTVLDLSTDGAAIKLETPLPDGTKASLLVESVSGKLIRISWTMRWSEGGRAGGAWSSGPIHPRILPLIKRPRA